MSTSGLAADSRQAADNGYLHNLEHAALNFLKAVFAVPAATRQARGVEAGAKEKSFLELYRITVGYDYISPKVAARLRAELVDD